MHELLELIATSLLSMQKALRGLLNIVRRHEDELKALRAELAALKDDDARAA